MDWKPLEGPQVILRPLDTDDVERCTRWMGDPEINQYVLMGRIPVNRTRELEWIASLYKSNTDVVFAIRRRADAEHIGNCGLHGIEWVDRFAVAGILIGETRWHGQGLGTEAMGLLVDYAFRVLNLNRVELSVYDFNERAIRSYRKLGFSEEGRQRRRRFKRGAYADEILMAILREEWEGRRLPDEKPADGAQKLPP